MNSSKLINKDSGNVEYYTPEEIIILARKANDWIEFDLDPASSFEANKTVRALTYYSENGLDKDWFGVVWMNHPFSRKENKLWIKKLVNEYKSGRVARAFCITFASTSEAWFRPLMQYPQCFIYGRTNYYDKDGNIKKRVTKGSVVTYLGNDVESFKRAFSEIGTVKI